MSARRLRAAAHNAEVLLLDIGNSRLKWALLRGTYRRGQAFAASGALPLDALQAGETAFSRLLAAFGPELRIQACNVAGVRIERQLRASVRRAGLRPPRLVRSARDSAGVRNAYTEPWRLGADRWVRLIGGRAEHPGRALCIVSAGTAVTLDLLDARGRHRGGSIMPGPRLMIESLLEGTAGIRRRAGGRNAATFSATNRDVLFARDTRAALAAGARYAAAGLIEQAMRSARVLLGARPRLLLGGGAADAIAPLLRVAHRREDELALRGLAVLWCLQFA
ncbi:MAG: type III pantothenate kinase [Steroidobacteraceae bacterium]